MNTPIIDFVRKYAEKGDLRLHMPGHKGRGLLGFEALDLTEIAGADSLFEANGIIKESEGNASALFGCETYYSTEGSSLCIRAMAYLVTLYAREKGVAPKVLAARNAHKTFLSACALLDMDVTWLYGEEEGSYLSCSISPETLETEILKAPEKPIAVYITSPDYLGGVADIAEISKVCRKHGVLLCVDSAHGAYLGFLPSSRHPIHLGADICCDSAHKTLPSLTGGAYLHIGENAPKLFGENAKTALSIFGSTSPSYLILQSLDAVNAYLADGYSERLLEFCALADECKRELSEYGYSFFGDEPLKLTVKTKPYGYVGYDLEILLKQNGITVEYSDRDHVVMMLTPETGEEGLSRLTGAMKSIKKLSPITEKMPKGNRLKQVMSIREATFSPSELLPVCECEGRVLAQATVSCPPAVPIAVCGEMLDKSAIEAFEYYGTEYCRVVK